MRLLSQLVVRKIALALGATLFVTLTKSKRQKAKGQIAWLEMGE
ncbi:hypothetical protein [Novosphingobium sp. CF614]|nr:hypothetical protein [Novosphingobium sp. CF614]